MPVIGSRQVAVGGCWCLWVADVDGLLCWKSRCELQKVVLLAARRAVGDCIGSCSGNVERVVDHVYWIWLWGYLMFDMF